MKKFITAAFSMLAFLPIMLLAWWPGSDDLH
jgi:hypothetical protein